MSEETKPTMSERTASRPMEEYAPKSPTYEYQKLQHGFGSACGMATTQKQESDDESSPSAQR